MGILKNTGVLLASEFIAKGIAFLLIPLYSFVIAPEDFGKIAILQLFFTGFFLIISFSLKSTFDKYYFDNDGKPVTALFTNLAVLQCISILFGSILYLSLRVSILDLIDIENTAYLDLVFFTSVVAIFFPVVSSYLICVGNVKKIGLISIVISIVRSLFALILVLKMENKILAVLLANFIEQLLGLLISMPYYFKSLKVGLIESTFIKEMGRYSILFFPAILSTFLIKFSDRLMIQLMLGYHSLGIYSMGTRLVNIPGQFISTVNKNFTPQIYQSISEKNRNKFNQLIKFFLIAIFVLLFALILFSKEIFYIIGENYQTSFIIFIILSFSSYINGYNLILQPSMTYFSEFVKYKSIIFMTIGVINIILNIIVIPIYGINGAAIVTAFSYFISIPFSYHYSKKAFSGDYFMKWFFLSSLALIGISIYMIFSANENSKFEFLIRVILYFGISYIFIGKLVNFKDLYVKLMRFLRKKITSK
ncbi:lipopolysaccharide biosynthesis protein [Maribacter sp. HTCC2170]|uniref:lipopolysaccharide biosynthesis protein n=1 Tax=Maribacter sp. (strain HTCC2170 / KCCM 42371) TaxID=313603 RepID=UPI00006BD3DC|nr:oligosaccharide flippase family protein [Maribacter sp. HTCC2170]EAR02771.1 polysaccharide biosynthesis protein [Maribacter sp. HTCC2170]